MAKTNILLVENKNKKRQELADILQKNKFNVTVVTYSGAKNLFALSSLPLQDLIITEKNIYGILKKIKKKDFSQFIENIPLMMIDDSTRAKNKNENITLAPYEVINFPIDEKFLIAGIGTALYIHEMSSRLKENEKQYKSLIELAPMAIGIHCEGKVAYANPAAVKLLGAKKLDELVGLPIINFSTSSCNAPSISCILISGQKPWKG